MKAWSLNHCTDRGLHPTPFFGLSYAAKAGLIFTPNRLSLLSKLLRGVCLSPPPPQPHCTHRAMMLLCPAFLKSTRTLSGLGGFLIPPLTFHAASVLPPVILLLTCVTWGLSPLPTWLSSSPDPPPPQGPASELTQLLGTCSYLHASKPVCDSSSAWIFLLLLSLGNPAYSPASDSGDAKSENRQKW